MIFPCQDQKKAKTININLTEEEYEKVRALDQIRDLNPTAYTRLAALGNRIKPTVIEMSKEQLTIEDVTQDERYQNQKQIADSQAKEVEHLRAQLQQQHAYTDLLNDLLTHINANGYINFDTYKEDKALQNRLRNIKNED